MFSKTKSFVNTRGGQPNGTYPSEPKPDQNICPNHSVKFFINPNGLVWFGFKPNRTEKPKCLFKLYIKY